MAIKEVRKRDGTIVSFDPSKIQTAIEKAMSALGSLDEKKAILFTKEITDELNSSGIKIPDIEQIQNSVEEILERHDERLFKIYSLYRRSRGNARKIKKA